MTVRNLFCLFLYTFIEFSFRSSLQSHPFWENPEGDSKLYTTAQVFEEPVDLVISLGFIEIILIFSL